MNNSTYSRNSGSFFDATCIAFENVVGIEGVSDRLFVMFFENNMIYFSRAILAIDERRMAAEILALLSKNMRLR